MIIEVKTEAEIECLVAVLSLGLCTAVESKCLSAEAAESYLFDLHSISLLQKIRAAPELVDLMVFGIELETLADHFPKALPSNLSKMKSIAQSVLQALPPPPEEASWLHLRDEQQVENPIQTALLSLLTSLDTLYAEHHELTDDPVAERMYDAVYHSFLVPKSDYALPHDFGMSSAQGNEQVREALSSFLNSPKVAEAHSELPTPQARLEAFQDPYVWSEDGRNFASYFPYRARL